MSFDSKDYTYASIHYFLKLHIPINFKNTNRDNELCHILLFQVKSILGELQVESISRLHQLRLLVATPMTILFDEILLQYNIKLNDLQK